MPPKNIEFFGENLQYLRAFAEKVHELRRSAKKNNALLCSEKFTIAGKMSPFFLYSQREKHSNCWYAFFIMSLR